MAHHRRYPRRRTPDVPHRFFVRHYLKEIEITAPAIGMREAAKGAVLTYETRRSGQVMKVPPVLELTGTITTTWSTA